MLISPTLWKKCSFVYNCPLKRYTVFPNCLLDVQRTRDMGTSFFTPLWQIECTSLVTTAIKENDNFLCGISELCPRTLRFKEKCLFSLPCEKSLFLCLQLPTQALYSFSQLLAWCSKDWENGNIFFHDAVPNGRRVPGDSSCKGKRQFPLWDFKVVSPDIAL